MSLLSTDLYVECDAYEKNQGFFNDRQDYGLSISAGAIR